MTSTTRLLDRLADALQRRHAAQPATSGGAATGQTVQLATPTVNLRRWLRSSWPRLKFALGFLFVTIGAGSSVIGFRADIRPLMERLIADGVLPAGWPALALGLVLGVLAALVIFWGEVLAAEHERWHWYLLFLVPDVRYTYRLFGYVIDAFGGGLIATGVGFVGAIVVAHFGEQWVFGMRRRGWVKRLILFQWGQG
jgi:hypothetical protein